jgi:hypothetical protein
MSELVQEQARPVAQPQGCASWFAKDGRLRSGWRVTLYIIAARLVDLVAVLVIGVVIAVTIARPLAQQGLSPSEIVSRITAMFSDILDYPLLTLGSQGTRLVLVLALVWLFRRFVDRKSFRSLGFETPAGWWQELLGGFTLSVVAWGVIFLLSLAFGAATIAGYSWDTIGWAPVLRALFIGFVLNVMVGILEETDARGYVLQNLAEGIRFWPAVIVSSAYFGLLHLLNPGAGFASTVGIFFAGVLLALGYYATGRLWFPIGMHAAWNFAEGPIFGFLVSGIRMGGLFQVRVVGPDWLMGGPFGPEAGVLAIAVETVLIVLLYLWARSRRKEPVYG